MYPHLPVTQYKEVPPVLIIPNINRLLQIYYTNHTISSSN